MPSAWDQTQAAPAAPAVSAWDATPVAPIQVAPQRSKFDLRGEGYDRAMNYDGMNALGGAVRGAGSIGSTVARPFESAQDNQDRRARLDQNMDLMLGSNPDSVGYKTNKVIAEIAGTSGIGGLLAKALRAIPGAIDALPTLLPAIESGGMSVNGAKGAYALANRAAGGAVNGAAMAGAVDPKDAQTGAIIGATTPVVAKGLALAGEKVGDAYNKRLAEELSKFSRNATKNQTIQQSLDAGYVIPPASVNPSFTNRAMESVSGKMATQQLASVKNADVTDGLVRNALGLSEDAPLSVGALEDIRKTAGTAYQQVAGISPKAASDLEALKIARNDASGWFKAYNRSASPTDLAKAKEARTLADTLETSLEQHAQGANRPELVPALRDARKLIAKTYTVERAMNPSTGNVDPKVLARMLQKGSPLSDGLDTVAQFASAFPTVSKRVEQIGSPDAHNLKAIASLAGTVGGAASMGPVGAIAGVIPFAAPPVARSIMFSGPVQRSLVQQAPKAGKAAQLAALLQNQAAMDAALRTAPVTGAALLGP